MWFAFGLVGLVVALAWQLRYRWSRPWAGAGTGIGHGLRQHLLSYKGNTVGIEIGCSVSPEFRFELKRETWVDRFFKWVGLSVEEQFGEHKFDRLVYVASNDRHLVNVVADTPMLRQAAVSLFQSNTPRCSVRRVNCANGWLVVRIRRRSMFSGKDDVKDLQRCARLAEPFLVGMAERLQSVQPAIDRGPGRRDPYLFRSIALLGTSTALAIHGFLFVSRPLFFDDVFTVDRGRLFELSLLCGGVILALLLLANFVLLGRSARGHLVLLELLLVGSFGAVASSAAELRDANIEWDASPPQRIETPIQDKSISRSRRGGTSYYVHVRDWAKPGARSIKVSSAFYDSVRRGDLLLVEQHEGRFGARWARVTGKASAPSAPLR